MSKKISIVTLIVLCIATGSFLAYNSETMKNRRIISQLVERNIEARGGMEAWKSVDSLRLKGRMDLGQGMTVPYVLEQKRPGKMRLEFEFNGQTAVQSSDGKQGWKLLPFRGQDSPEPMSEDELREVGDTSHPYGVLFDYASRGIELELLGREVISGHDAFKLKATLPRGAVRWLYLDTETALELKLESLRTLRGKKRVVETRYHNWKESQGLLIAHLQETRTEGENEWHRFTIRSVDVNPPLEDSHFTLKPATAVTH